MNYSKMIFAILAGLVWTACSPAADAPAIPQRVIEGPLGVQVIVKMVGPVTQVTDLQIICILQHNPAGDQYIEAAKDLNAKLGGLISNFRDRGEFAGDLGETLLITPPAGSIAAKRLLLIGAGEEKSLDVDRLRPVGTIAARQALELGTQHVSFAPTLRDQGSNRIPVSDVDAAMVESFLLAYDTAKNMQAQGLSPKGSIANLTIEAGPKFFESAVKGVQAAVVAAEAQIGHRDHSPYAGVK